CDVVQADGGTRTASINGAAIALGLLIREACQEGRFAEDPRVSLVAAISAGIVAGEAYLDLDYSEDHRAEIDLNLVGTPEGELVEVQGSSESQPISWERWQQLIELGLSGLRQVGEQSQRWMPPLAGSERV
ncbi:MAG: ribonuclease PH, partial [Planctomycetota bacterium]